MLPTYAKMRILMLYSNGYRAPKIEKLLKEEGIRISRVSIWKFISRYKKTGCVARMEGSGRPAKISPEVMALVEEQMRANDKTTAFQLHKMLNERGIDVSIWTILRCRRSLGWTFHGSAYCQLIRDANKQARLEWAKEYIEECDDGFLDVIWSDEATIQLEIHKRFCCRKKGCWPKNKPRY